MTLHKLTIVAPVIAVVQLYRGIVFSNEKELSADTCSTLMSLENVMLMKEASHHGLHVG